MSTSNPGWWKRYRWWLLIATAALVAGANYAWWYHRPRQPTLDGEIEDATLTLPVAACVRNQSAPCRSFETIEALMAQPDLRIRVAAPTSGGMQGAAALALLTTDGVLFKAKWRAHASASIVNTPAKEVAAYQLQKLLLSPEDFVVPPTVGHCFPLAHYREMVDPEAEPLEGTECVFGFLSYWLTGAITLYEARKEGLLETPAGEDGVYSSDPQLLDASRFVEDLNYRRNLAHINVVTFLVHNGDAHAGQFVLYEDPWHLFLVDSSISFRSIANPTTMLLQDLSKMIVPMIPQELADDARTVSRLDLDRLLVLEEYGVDDGVFVHREPGEAFDPQQHVRLRVGQLQIGLRPRDIDGVFERLAGLRGSLEDGSLQTF